MSLFDFHTHSHYSTDSHMIPKKIVAVAKKKGLKGVAITDHNTVKGGFEAKIESDGSDFIVIVGSEIMTEVGEIIGLFLHEEITSTNSAEVLDQIHAQDGISVLPHPYRSYLLHRSREREDVPEAVVERIQFIEGVNARTWQSDNQKALNLATKLKKPLVTGSDAHFYQEIGRVTTTIKQCTSEEDLRKNLRIGNTIVDPQQGSFLKAIPYIFLSGLYGRTRFSQNSSTKLHR